jgi:hypothetical protein
MIKTTVRVRCESQEIEAWGVGSVSGTYLLYFGGKLGK